MAYAVEISKAAKRQLRKLDQQAQRRVADRIDSLAENPRPSGVVKLTGVTPPVHRVREGQYRILYTIEDDQLIVLVVRIAHRSEAYR
jgi:mRNA interferase RelE/StbE